MIDFRMFFCRIFLILGYLFTLISPFGLLALGIFYLISKGIYVKYLLIVILCPFGCLLGIPFIFGWYFLAYKTWN
jgi:hypothetical protein